MSTLKSGSAAIWTACLFAVASMAGIADRAVAQPEAVREVTVTPASFVRGSALPAWFERQQRLPESDSHEPAIVRFSYSHFRVGDPSSVVVHRAILVNDASALPEVGQYAIAFQPDFQRVELHWLKVHRGGQVIDKLVDANVRYYHSERNAEQGIYSGAITAVVVTPDLRPGDTLEIIYSLVGQNPVFGGRYTESAAWDSQVRVLQRRVTLDVPKGRSVYHKVIGNNGDKPPVARESESGDRRLIRYEADGLPPVEQEPMVPPDYQPIRWIQFAEYKDWRDVAAWASQLFETGPTPPSLLPTSIAGATPAESLIRALRFVQEDIRYLSMSIGENSHRPYAPAEVLARRYGDCKDKSLLLVTLLRHLGIEAEPVLIAAQVRKGLREMLPSSALFDHVIVRARIDGQVYFLDPTLNGQADGLEHLGQLHAGADAFVVASATKELTSVPAQKVATPSRRVERVEVRSFDEPAEMRIEFAYAAEDAEAMRRALARLSPAQIRKAYEGILARRYPLAELLADPQVQDDRKMNVLIIAAHYRIPNLFEKQDDKWTVPYEASNLANLLPVPPNAKRRDPLYLSAYPWSGNYSLEITLPEEFNGRYTPARRTLQSEGFAWQEQLTFSGRLLKADLTLVFNRDRIPAAGTAQYLADLRAANGFIRGSLNVQNRDRRTTAVEAPLRELSRQRLEGVLRNTESALAKVGGGGRETSSVRCERALAAAYLEQSALAMAEADKAVNEQPTSADMLRCRGTVRLVAADFAAAIRDLTRALALGNDEADTYFQRGLAHFQARHFPQAEDDFVMFGRRAADGSAKARAAVWAALARGRTGQSMSARKSESDSWPAPILAVLSSESKVEDLIERLNRDESGSKLEEQLAEAYFYFSQHYASTNRAKSQAYLRRSIDLGPLYSLIHVAALHEAARLAGAGR